MKNALVILGSPHANGITDNMGQTLAQEFGTNGLHVTTVAVRDFHIASCQGCQKCAIHPHVCPLADKDEASAIFDLLLKADLVATASPVYFYALPAHFKALVDRSQPLWFGKDAARQERPFIALMAAGRLNGGQLFTGSLRTLSLFLKPFGFRLRDRILVRGTDAGPVLPPIMKEIRQRGKIWSQLLTAWP